MPDSLAVGHDRLGFRHRASLRAFCGCFRGVWTRVKALEVHPGYKLFGWSKGGMA
jgi:hypothetical protein